VIDRSCNGRTLYPLMLAINLGGTARIVRKIMIPKFELFPRIKHQPITNDFEAFQVDYFFRHMDLYLKECGNDSLRQDDKWLSATIIYDGKKKCEDLNDINKRRAFLYRCLL
jgi:hypothetical protein